MSVEIPPVVGKKHLPPDPAVIDALGLNHALKSAIADLVDNSIDAVARVVLIRFVRQGRRLVSLLIVDDGRGMDDATLDDAMTIGRRRARPTRALGHFGLGLKSASLSQANVLTVLSRRSGHPATARQWVLDDARRGFECAVLAQAETDLYLDTDWGPVTTTTGTVVRWDDVRTFPGASDGAVTTRWLEGTVTALRHHLGLVFHRLLDADAVQIVVDVVDAETDTRGPTQQIHAIDPFGYSRSGAPGYPKAMRGIHGGHAVDLVCHVWPRSEAPGYRLGGAGPSPFQGFYFYRHDRLLQAGGWNGVTNEDRRLQQARVVVDIDDELRDLVTMNAEKNAVTVRPEFALAVERARATDGTTFADFLEVADAAHRHANARTARRSPVVPPGQGLHPKVRRAVAAGTELLPDDAVNIRWKPLRGDTFFEVDRSNAMIWLNSAYRDAVLRDRTAGVNDVPLLKTLVYLLMQEVFKGSWLGPKDRDDIAFWNAVLSAAARAEADT